MRILPPRVQGGIPREVVHRVMRRHIHEMRYCYEQTLNRRPEVRGRVSLRFAITPAATVGASSVTANTTGDAALGTCLAQRVRRWRFPTCTGCGVDMVHADLVFERQ